MTIAELREKAAQEADAAQKIQDLVDEDGRHMTQDEVREFDDHLDAAKLAESQADRKQRLEDQQQRLEKPQDRQSVPEINTGAPIKPVAATMYQYGTLRAFKGKDAATNAYRSGRFLAASLFGHAASRQWCNEHGVEVRIATDMDIGSRAMAEGINTAGGYLVPDELEAAVITLREEYGDARRNCRIKLMVSDHSNQPKKVSGLTAYAIGENVEFTESEQEWGNVELTAKKWGVLLRISNELSEDTLINLAEDIANDIALAFATSEDESAIDGDGTGTYHGIVGVRTKMIDGSHLGSYVEAAATGDNWSELTDTDLLNVMAVLPKYARRNAKWHCSPLAKVAVFDRLIKAVGGATMAETVQGPIQPRYMSYPIEEWPAMPTVDAAAALNNKIMLFFGDMMLSTTMGIRRGMTVKRLEERYAEFDQIGILATERFTINNHSIGGATTALRGPVVGLLGTT